MGATYDLGKPGPIRDGFVYASNNLMPAAEGNLWNVSEPSDQTMIILPWAQAIYASVKFTAQGNINTTNAYVVMQMDAGDDNWIDVAWCPFTGASGSITFVLSAGNFICNAVQQTRANNTAPNPAIGSNQLPVGGRLRFMGKATVTAGSSSSASLTPRSSSSSSAGPAPGPGVLVNIVVKLLGLR